MSGTRGIAGVLAALMIPAAALAAYETRTVEVVAEVFGQGRTPEEARREALQRARDKAVAEVTGIHIAAQQLRLKTETPGRVDDAFSYLVQTSTHGRIVREQVAYDTRLVDDVPVYRARLVAEVALEEGLPDPGFTVDVEVLPATRMLRDGEPISFEITASRDCYLIVLNVRADQTVGLLFPNRYDDTNRIEANEPFALPGRDDGFEIRAEREQGAQAGGEQILVIATLDAVPFRLPQAAATESTLAEEGDPSIAALNRWLLQIPVDRRAESLWEYRVVE